jgi:5-methylcytosine-specific restriction endonuclease McrA
MDSLLTIVVLSPLLILIWFLVRYALRIRRDALDKDERIERLDDLDPDLVQFVLERDQHTCQRCGTSEQVGVDFVGITPGEDEEISDSNLEACCSRCFFDHWKTLQDDTEVEQEDERSQTSA